LSSEGEQDRERPTWVQRDEAGRALEQADASLKHELDDALPGTADELGCVDDSKQALDDVPPDIAADLLSLYDRDAANAWLIGQHPLLGHRSPLSELAHGRIAEVRAALRSDAADSFA
jgi:hypothetical protein